MGSEPIFPGGDNQPHTNAFLESEAAIYSHEIDGVVDKALAGAVPVTVGGVGASTVHVDVPATNALLVGVDLVDAPSDVSKEVGVGAQVVRGLERSARRVGLAVTPKPGDLMADQDPFVAQMQCYVSSGACQAGLP
jgi:hypothetical protein